MCADIAEGRVKKFDYCIVTAEVRSKKEEGRRKKEEGKIWFCLSFTAL
ncbi:MAG: hypothetical protein F6K48_11520 [Okeania sp. SIO3H1]|nr:hypothetical protein [Okeania sp. SIO3H1]